MKAKIVGEMKIVFKKVDLGLNNRIMSKKVLKKFCTVQNCNGDFRFLYFFSLRKARRDAAVLDC
jgi:hypothetical protein